MEVGGRAAQTSADTDVTTSTASDKASDTATDKASDTATDPASAQVRYQTRLPTACDSPRAYFFSAPHRTTNTGHDARRKTCSVVLPSSI